MKQFQGHYYTSQTRFVGSEPSETFRVGSQLSKILLILTQEAQILSSLPGDRLTSLHLCIPSLAHLK